MPTKNPFTKTFTKNALALEEKLSGLNVPAAFEVIREQHTVNAVLFYTWLFTKYSGYSYEAVQCSDGPCCYLEPRGSTKSWLRCDAIYSVLELTLDGKGRKVDSHMFLEVFADMCYEFKAHVAAEIASDYRALLAKCKTLRIPFPNIQVQVAQPDPAWTGVNKKPVLLLFRNPEDASFVKLGITKTQASQLEAMGCIKHVEK